MTLTGQISSISSVSQLSSSHLAQLSSSHLAQLSSSHLTRLSSSHLAPVSSSHLARLCHTRPDSHRIIWPGSHRLICPALIVSFAPAHTVLSNHLSLNAVSVHPTQLNFSELMAYCAASGSGARRDGDKNGYPGSFGIPWVNGKNGRFCPFCGRAIRDYAHTGRCPHSQCRRILPQEVPELSAGFIWCGGCNLTYVAVCANFCGICRWATPAGKQWKRVVADGRRRIAQMEAQLQLELEAFQNAQAESTRVVRSPVITLPFATVDLNSSMEEGDEILADIDMPTGSGQGGNADDSGINDSIILESDNDNND